jgi:uncharacterized surface protein with fasciclin (FAS1) repeats
MKASAIALAAVFVAPVASKVTGTYKGSVPLILDCTITFPGDGTMDFDQNVKVASTEVKCPTEKIAETDSLVTFPEVGNDGDCFGDALRGQSKDPSKFSIKINSDGTLTFVSDGWPNLKLKPQSSLEEHKPNIVELAESVQDLSTLVSAVVAADLVDTLSSKGPFTVFAPTNAAFGALPAGTLDGLMKPENKGQLVDILTYHVLPAQVLAKDVPKIGAVATVEGKNLIVQKNGDTVTVGPSQKDQKTVTAADNLASNGVAHIIDGVMLPPSKSPTIPNIVELAETVKDLSTLVSAVVAADLVDTLSSKGPFTVFAPTNAGFAALPAGTLDNLMKPENKAQLADILTYHVLPIQAYADDLDLFQPVTTVEGKPLHIQKWGGKVKVGPSLKSEDLKSVTAADNAASNGVVHIIDGVLLPPSSEVVV